MNDANTIHIWLNELERALAGLPEASRRDIVNEARAHLEDRVAAGLSARSALHGFGTVKDYARPFIEDFLLSRAITSNHSLHMIKALVTHSARSIVAFLGLTFAATFGGLTLINLLWLIDKIGSPDKVGYFTDSGANNYIGHLPASALGATEQLGPWWYVLTIAGIILSLFLARLCLRLSGFAIVRARSQSA
ncbi:HAAS signaling domain-containing protein [Asticcacaulis excentricus]|uniref:DUF1700 domain-containing protein n=1 Tax=Asticcacaulis excentricus (strain ATCC 15261 / DSM 4724 / KCTC 12464 / NCIMB 9791 / VKM B-1370 / CB 48) TaxID=573065 RepID=E8RQY7_ASTEC|nr:hypothetical protein [Asticcacaulis excentricus]ADU12250.1 hypothetical protein Astex_0561 [Asticcacaulis excentricus CB 48]